MMIDIKYKKNLEVFDDKYTNRQTPGRVITLNRARIIPRHAGSSISVVALFFSVARDCIYIATIIASQAQ